MITPAVNTVREYPGRAEWVSDTARLVRRVTMGITSAEAARATAHGYDAYLESQLAIERIDDSAVDASIARNFPDILKPTEEIHELPHEAIVGALQGATLYRMVFSRRQLYERMVEFWTDHFSVSIDKVGVMKVRDDREVIRRYAFGSFGDLLRAVCRSVSMLGYLDQYLSTASHPNQNFARELMELHTVGVDGGYTETDVAELSRALTGWTFDRRWSGYFTFDPMHHDWGPKRVMGLTIPAGDPSAPGDGVKDGERAIEMLLAHRNTGRFIATKMLRWLLTPAPSEEQIAAVAAAYESSGGDIRSMVRATLRREWLAAAPAKFKRPVHFVASALRALSPAVGGMSVATGLVRRLGQPAFRWEAPDGYPDSLDYWGGNLPARWSVASDLAASASPAELDVRVDAYLADGPDGAVTRIGRELFGGELPSDTHRALVAHARTGPFTEARVRELIALALGSPAFQWY